MTSMFIDRLAARMGRRRAAAEELYVRVTRAADLNGDLGDEQWAQFEGAIAELGYDLNRVKTDVGVVKSHRLLCQQRDELQAKKVALEAAIKHEQEFREKLKGEFARSRASVNDRYSEFHNKQTQSHERQFNAATELRRLDPVRMRIATLEREHSTLLKGLCHD